tara:strand:+ start:112 stop:630 length:519 start_codon:yes stop_codon:yes gene_type:complete
MNDRLKNRITGVVILVLLAVIVTPILFKGSGQKVLKFKEISDQKDIVFKYVDEAENLNKNQNIEVIRKNLDAKIVSLESLDKSKEGKSKEKIWVIKIGSYSKKINAENQIQDLLENKHQSFILKSDQDNKILYSVNVGPFFSIKDVKNNYVKLIKNKKYINSYIVESVLKNK